MDGLLHYLRYQLSRLTKDQRGASALEYTLLIVMVALVIVAFVTPVRTQISIVWSRIVSAITPL